MVNKAWACNPIFLEYVSFGRLHLDSHLFTGHSNTDLCLRQVIALIICMRGSELSIVVELIEFPLTSCSF